MWEGVGDRTQLQYIDPHSYGRQRCVFLVLQGCSTGGPEAHSAGWWLSLLHLFSNFSGPQLIEGSKGPLHRAFSSTSNQQLLWTPTLLTSNPIGAPRAPSTWCGFPYHISSITPTDLQLIRGSKGPLHRAFSTTSCLLTRLISNCLTFCLDRVI